MNAADACLAAWYASGRLTDASARPADALARQRYALAGDADVREVLADAIPWADERPDSEEQRLDTVRVHHVDAR